MTQLTPDQALIIHNALLLPTMKVEHRITRSVIAALPDDQKDYRPNEVAKTAFDLAWHLASAEHGFRMGVDQRRVRLLGARAPGHGPDT